MSHQYAVNPRPPTSCAVCPFLRKCGGLEGPASDNGCFQRCVDYCQFHGCDLACPCLHLSFAELIEDVEGLCVPPRETLKPCVGTLPFYITQILHGSRRDVPLQERAVAVPLTSLVWRDQAGRYGVKYSTPESMREGLMLSRETEVIVTSVGYDQPLEDFWAEHVKRDVLTHLAALKIRAMTVPNFSFMSDVPRINSLYNLTRMHRLAERMTAANIPTVMHLQACTHWDWRQWATILRDQPTMNVVAMEFQTGARRQKVGNKYYGGLVELQDHLGRSLHPIVIGGSGRVRDLAQHFDSFSVVDATPFMKTVYRQEILAARQSAETNCPHSTEPGASLSGLLAHNIASRRARLLQKVEESGAQFGTRILMPSAA
ncbi:MAG TPA: DUF4417 domain-containing protein [Chthoniobacteraceae bacterium]|nr:DUF4417 domain-containing protein [Chthoniobacteraceae bacterium]